MRPAKCSRFEAQQSDASEVCHSAENIPRGNSLHLCYCKTPRNKDHVDSFLSFLKRKCFEGPLGPVTCTSCTVSSDSSLTWYIDLESAPAPVMQGRSQLVRGNVQRSRLFTDKYHKARRLYITDTKKIFFAGNLLLW